MPKRAAYDRETIDAILDEAIVCHLGFLHEGRPFVIPTLQARSGDVVYVHGSAASRMLRSLAEGTVACLAVTLVDGLVLARSAFHHSVNYRSVVIQGRAEPVTVPDEKRRALEAFTEHLVQGRWAEVRLPTSKELAATAVLRMPIDEASAKVRTGPPMDDEDDYELDVWAGVLPLGLTPGEPEADKRLRTGVEAPEYVRGYSRGR